MRESGEVFILPYASYSGTGTTYTTVNFIARPGQIIVTRSNNADNTKYPAPFTSATEFRYVLIPGGTSLALRKQVDLGNYEAVRKYFRLKD